MKSLLSQIIEEIIALLENGHTNLQYYKIIEAMEQLEEPEKTTCANKMFKAMLSNQRDDYVHVAVKLMPMLQRQLSETELKELVFRLNSVDDVGILNEVCIITNSQLRASSYEMLIIEICLKKYIAIGNYKEVKILAHEYKKQISVSDLEKMLQNNLGPFDLENRTNILEALDRELSVKERIIMAKQHFENLYYYDAAFDIADELPEPERTQILTEFYCLHWKYNRFDKLSKYKHAIGKEPSPDDYYQLACSQLEKRAYDSAFTSIAKSGKKFDVKTLQRCFDEEVKTQNLIIIKLLADKMPEPQRTKSLEIYLDKCLVRGNCIEAKITADLLGKTLDQSKFVPILLNTFIKKNEHYREIQLKNYFPSLDTKTKKILMEI